MSAKKIVILGSCNTDMVIRTEHLPVPGETILGGEFMMNPGGKGANQAVAAARLGGDIAFITKVGNDLFGKQSVEGYEKENIDTKYIFSDPNNPSGVALIMVDSKAENCIAVASGANGTLLKKEVDESREVIENAEILLMQLEVPYETVAYAAEMANKAGVKVILNPAPAIKLPDDIYPNLHMITPNTTEAEILSGVKVTDWDSAKKAADVIAAKGANIVIITLGSLGALIKKDGEYIEVPIEVKVKAVDTTAAGDTFCGALVVAMSEGMELHEAVRFANRAAGLSVTKPGAQMSIPYRNEVIL